MKILLSAITLALLVSACGDDASKKGSPNPTPPPAEKKTEPKK